ncbi:YpbF family protein [Bacillaceae bacterium Marseille-Q3522]|nr:YpbF family protein [Bacillaceae bacterium Marseille-Q3522]
MDDAIKMLDHQTDETTKQMLQHVIDKKKKFDKRKKIHVVTIWGTSLLSFTYFIYLYYFIVNPYSYSFAAMFSAFVNETTHLYWLLLVIGMFGFMNLMRKEKEKTEDEYHALRCEIIDKSKDLWKEEASWKNRHLVFEMIKKKYDINLFVENK